MESLGLHHKTLMNESLDNTSLENERFRLGERCLQTGREKGVDWEFSGMLQVFSDRQKIF